jgi:3-oxoacyl-[acyl-carrier protein] reductase
MNSHLSDDDKSALADEIPAGRFGTPAEIAHIVKQLTEAPSYLTGQIITVDGGWT